VHDPEGNEVPCELKDNGDGTYEATYTPVVPGKHEVSVMMDGKPLRKMPRKVEVVPATPDPSQCTASGPGVEGPVTVGEEAPITIQAVNRAGVPIKVGGAKVHAVATPLGDGEEEKEGKKIEMEVKDNGDGTYSAAYTPALFGKTRVDIEVAGDKDEMKPIRDSPFTVETAKDPAKTDAGQSYAFGPGVEDGKCDTALPAEFTIQACNPAGEKMPEGGDTFRVGIKGPDGADVPAEVTDNGDGTYGVKYEPKTPGDYEIAAELVNPVDPELAALIKDMPKKVHIEPGVDASKCVVEGPGVEDGVEDTKGGDFTIEPLDCNGDKLPEDKLKDLPFEVEVTQPDGTPLPADNVHLEPRDDGKYDVKYDPLTDGPHKVAVSLRGVPVGKSPYSVQVVAGADAEGSGVGEFGFTLQARDRKGEPMTTGGAKFEVTVKLDELGSEPIDCVEVTDNGDGTYTAKYHIDEPGTYKIYVKLNGRTVKGTPFKQQAF